MTTSSILSDLRSCGRRVTAAKRRLIDLLSASDRPLTAKELLTNTRVHKTTVYRELTALTAHGCLSAVDFGDGIKRYELTSRGHHHHLVCTKCKSITDVDVADDFSKIAQTIASQKKFTITGHNLEFFGICRLCKPL